MKWTLLIIATGLALTACGTNQTQQCREVPWRVRVLSHSEVSNQNGTTPVTILSDVDGNQFERPHHLGRLGGLVTIKTKMCNGRIGD